MRFKLRQGFFIGFLAATLVLGYSNCSNDLKPFSSSLSTQSSTSSGNSGNSTGSNNNNNPPPAPTGPTLVSLSANTGPLFGDHFLTLTGLNFPPNKKVVVNFGNIPCVNLVVVDDKTITCITPSEPASKVDVILLVDSVETSRIALGYEYAPSESLTNISLNAGIPVRDNSTPIYESGNIYLWGGVSAAGTYIAQGSIYNTLTDTWQNMDTANQPAPRIRPAAISTGKELIVWGGYNGSSFFNDGGRYNYATKTWSPMSTAGAPSARYGASGVWTGSKMIVWGGANIATVNLGGGTVKTGSNAMADGAIYDPQTNTWAPTANSGLDGVYFHFAHWSGSEMFVYGGYQGFVSGGSFNQNSYVGAYNPTTNTWRKFNTSNVISNPAEGLAWMWFTGTKWMIQGVSFTAGSTDTIPRFLDSVQGTWVNVPQGKLPTINYDTNSPPNYDAVWSGRYMYLIQNGSGGYKYSFN